MGFVYFRDRKGSILAEWLVAIGICLIIVGMGSSVWYAASRRYILNQTTEEVVYQIKRVQVWSMLGHHNALSQPYEFVMKKRGYTMQEGYQQDTPFIAFPRYIESNREFQLILFSAYGLPYEGTEITLYDTETGYTNRIWISVQTGRIRWEEVDWKTTK